MSIFNQANKTSGTRIVHLTADLNKNSKLVGTRFGHHQTNALNVYINLRYMDWGFSTYSGNLSRAILPLSLYAYS